MDPRFSSSWVAFSGSLFMAYGFVAYVLSTFQSSLSTDAGTYVRVLGDTIISVVVGAILIILAILTISRVRVPGNLIPLVGFGASLVGMLNAIQLVTIFGGVSFSLQGSQSVIVELLLWVGAILAIFIAFPLGTTGSILAKPKPEEKDNHQA